MIELDEIKLGPDYATIFIYENPNRNKDAIRITLEPCKNTNLITVYRNTMEVLISTIQMYL